MPRWAAALLAACVLLVLIAAATVWLTLKASLPPLDGAVAGMPVAAAVTIQRDAAGIPTITAANREDLSFGLGFVHGQDRFFQMDLLRRDAAGELAAIIGPAAVEHDLRRRLHRFRSRAGDALAALTAAEGELLQRYAAGVNAGLQSLAARPFEYHLLRVSPAPWSAEDSLLVAYAMFFNLNDERAMRDRQRGLMATVFAPEVLDWLDPAGTRWDAPLAGPAFAVPPIPGPELLSAREQPFVAAAFDESGEPAALGSNNWAVSGALTPTGHALVSNDMHLGLDVPTIFYRARLVDTGPLKREIAGVSLPGQPLIIAGSNGHIGWGFTNSYGDWSDAVVLKPGAFPGSYRTPGGDRSFEIYPERIEVKGADAVSVAIRETIWGPVDPQSAHPDGEIAISWIAHHPGALNLGILELESARTVFEAVNVANTIAMPPQNFVTGDALGNIGWTLAGRIPARTDYDPGLPADWSEQEGWQGWVPARQYPRIVNPPGGRIWTANARVIGDDALRLIGQRDYALGARAGQIRDALSAGKRFAPEDMLAIQMDDRALYLAQWRELLLEVLADSAATRRDPALQEYRRLVANWLPRAAPESVGYRLVRAFHIEFRQRLFDALVGPVRERFGASVELGMGRQFDGTAWSVIEKQPAHLLPAGFASWNEFMVEAVRGVIAHYEQEYPGPLAERSWGEYNQASIRHPLSAALPWLSRWLDMPVEPLSGDSMMPKAQGRNWGASERFSVYPGAEQHSLMHMPGGQSGHPLSDFYRHGHRAWVDGTPSPFLPGEERHKLILTPRSR